MKSILKWGLLALLAAVLMGCIETITLIRLNRDGSGTIEETVIISNSFMEIMAGMGGESGEAAEEPDFLNEDELLEKAKVMGEGVKLVSAEKLSTEKGNGYKAIYSFKDINQVRINQNPGENLPQTGGPEEEAVEELITFRFTKGNPATLIVINPSEDEEYEEEPGEEEYGGEEDPAMMDMLKGLYQDMLIRIAIEVNGSIVDTNATYRDGSRVTILEMDFAKLLEDEEAFKKLIASKPETLEETKELIKDNPGIKVELRDEIRIRFK